MKGQTFRKRLNFALQGLYLAFCRERSVRSHLIAGSGVIMVLLWTRPPAIWWAITILTVGMVLMAELMNAALETLADHLHPERHANCSHRCRCRSDCIFAAMSSD